MPHPPEDVDPIFEAVAAEMDAWLGDDATGHDLAHGWRVFNTAMELADSYPEADRKVLGAAALVHDVHRAMGAVGVARCFAYSGAHDRPMWTPDSDEPSAIDHFREKLLNLREEMHTEAARAVAEDRHDFLESFLDRFEAEWYGRV